MSLTRSFRSAFFLAMNPLGLFAEEPQKFDGYRRISETSYP